MNTALLFCSVLNCSAFGIAPPTNFLKSTTPIPGCPQQMQVQWIDHAQIYHFQSGQRCLIYLSPDPKTIVFRSYALSSEGMFQIFNSFGEGDESISAGARVFFFFPKAQQIHAAWDGQDQIQVMTASQEVMTFSSRRLALVKGSVTDFKEDPKISGKNSGGVEVVRTPGWYVDSGFKVGSSPFLDPRRTSRVVDPKGVFCDIPNPELFIYDPRSGDGRLRSEAEVIRRFRAHCSRKP